jgi:hydroxyacyl-ACP dehydratase HTD2-like protein with hotdog domain
VNKQIYYEDIAVGREIPSLVKHPTTRQLVKWAGASTDFYEIHYDKDHALRNGLPSVIVHGQLSASLLGQLLSDWIGVEGSIRKFSVSYRGMNVPFESLTCKGKVTNKYVKNGEHFVECDIWVENPKAEKTVIGSAVVTVPSRG